VALGLAAYWLYTTGTSVRLWKGLFIAAALFSISLGPVILPGSELDAPVLSNPVYMGLHHVVPGFWRVAKPEVFFQPIWLLLLVASACGLRTVLSRNRAMGLACIGLMLAVWWPLVRAHPAFPGMSAPIESTLSPTWEREVFGRPADGR
jgi:hypothetical protein